MPSINMKSFSFKKKDGGDDAPPSPARSAAAKSAPAPSPPRSAAAPSASGGGMARFGFGKKFNRNKAKDDNIEEQTAAPTPSPKKSRRRVEYDDDDADYDDVRASKSSGGGGGMCTCKRLVGGTCCVLLLTVVGIVTWRYGPWAKDDAAVTTLDANTCPDCCNGLKSNCALPVNEVLFPMVHNAHSSYANGFVGADNNRPFEEALVAGYRALRLSTCLCEGFLSKALLERDAEWGLGESDLGFCHTACGAGVRDPKDVLTNLRDFVETNPREILIIEFDMGDGSSSDLRTALGYSGLLNYVYQPQGEYYIEEWPTMQELIDANTRVLLFASGDDMRSCPSNACEDGILYSPDHILQTNTDGSDLDACDATISGDVYVGYFAMNHYAEKRLTMPSPRKARERNAFSKLEERFAGCEGKRRPGLLAVQFWDEGEVLDFVSNVNAGKNGEGGERSLVAAAKEAKGHEGAASTEGAARGLRG